MVDTVDTEKCCEHNEETHYGTPDKECHAAMCQCKKFVAGGSGGPDKTSDARGSARTPENAPGTARTTQNAAGFDQAPISRHGVKPTPENPQGLATPAGTPAEHMADTEDTRTDAEKAADTKKKIEPSDSTDQPVPRKRGRPKTVRR